MKKAVFVLAGTLILCAVAASPANANWTDGYVFCDVNQNGEIDAGDTPYEGVIVNVSNVSDTWSAMMITSAGGYYHAYLPDAPDSYEVTIDPVSLPADAVFIHPVSGEYAFSLDAQIQSTQRLWLIDSATCRDGDEEGLCWFTGGGVKFSNITDTLVAQRGPQHNMGGNVHPSCDPDPGEGGQWNHVAHALKLHFLGTSIHTVACGNVPGIEPGSESPVTPFNYIEYWGIGTLKGIKGNKVDYGTVHFFARAEDRNEPGSNGATAGEDIDRYMIHVYSDPANPEATTLMLLDVDGDPGTIDPVTITGGNLQLHISSCDDPM